MAGVNSSRLDQGETIFFEQELEHVKAKAYQKKYPLMKALNGLFPISTEADPADETITYEMFDEVGVAKIIASYADDLPVADIKGERFTSDIRGIGTSYGYSIQEIRKGSKTGKPLKQSKANSSKRANDQEVNRIAWYGDSKYNLVGFLFHPNVTSEIVQVGATSGNSLWSGKLPSEILTDMNAAVTDTIELTNGVEAPDTMILPIAQYALIQKTPLAAGSDTTILQFFLANNPSITRIDWVNELKDVTPAPTGASGPVNVMATYTREADHLSLEIPQFFEQLPPEPRNLAYKVACHSRCGGMIIAYPLSVRLVEGV